MVGIAWTMRQVPLEHDINIVVNGCSGFATSTKNGPFMAMLISRSRGTYLIGIPINSSYCIPTPFTALLSIFLPWQLLCIPARLPDWFYLPPFPANKVVVCVDSTWKADGRFMRERNLPFGCVILPKQKSAVCVRPRGYWAMFMFRRE